MRRFGISRRALADFDEIVDYLTAVAGQAVADKYGRDIRASIVRMAENPGAGSPRPELGTGVGWSLSAPISFSMNSQRARSRYLCFAFCMAGET